MKRISGKNEKYELEYEKIFYENKPFFKIIHSLYIDGKKVYSLKNKLELIRKQFKMIPVVKHHYIKQEFLKKWKNNNKNVSYGSFVREKVNKKTTDKILYLEDLNLVILNDKIIYFEDGLNAFLENLIDQMASRINFVFVTEESILSKNHILEKLKESLISNKYYINIFNKDDSLKENGLNNLVEILEKENNNLENCIFCLKNLIESEKEKVEYFKKDLIAWAFVVVFYDIVFKPDFKRESNQIFSDFIRLLCDSKTASKTDFSNLASLFSGLGLNLFNMYHIDKCSEYQMLKDSSYTIELIRSENFPLSNKRTEFLNIDSEKIILIPLSPSQIIIIAKESFINSKKMNLNVLEEYYINSAIERYENNNELEKESDDLIIFQDESKIESYKSILSTKEKIFYDLFKNSSLKEISNKMEILENKPPFPSGHKKLKLNIHGKVYNIDYFKDGRIKVNNKVINDIDIIKKLKTFY
jgi:hypothetical protein